MKPTGVIVPIELWREISSEKETAYLLQSEAMKRRLREGIRQAREMYESRVPPEARADHFERAMVDVLAGGDQSLMGD
jgi:hypothetical protein